jgi:hypothetical protein
MKQVLGLSWLVTITNKLIYFGLKHNHYILVTNIGYKAEFTLAKFTAKLPTRATEAALPLATMGDVTQ